MSFNIYEFRSQLQGDGARPNLFDVQLTFPTFINPGAASRKATFMCKSASLPSSTLGMVPVPYFGRDVKLAGNRQFQEWTVNIINDEDFNVRNAFEKWSAGINSHVGNIRAQWAGNSLGYAVDANVNQYGKKGDKIKTYTFIGMFPIDIGQIDLDWGANDTVEEYSVTFAVQSWTAVSPDGTVIL